MKRKVNQYTDEFKLKVVTEYLETEISQEELKRKYGFGGNSCISNWMLKFGMKSPSEDQLKLQRIMSEEHTKSPREAELEKRIQELENSLDKEQLRALALDTMINIAERELKISIRKKPGTKQ